MTQFQKYSDYKPSGVEWLGDVPKHWDVRKLKYISNVVLGKMLCNESKGSYQLKPYLKSKNIQWLNVDVSSVDEMWFSEKEMIDYRLKKGDLVLSEGGEVGKTCIWNEELEECYIQNSAHKVTFHENGFSQYYLYQFFTIGQFGIFDSIVNRVSIGHLTKDKLINIEIIQPPIEEQTAIAHYLDEKTAQLDTAIVQKEQMIALLKERRQILIHRAVTQGLDPSVKMKDSRVEWIGEVPEHWEIHKVKHIFRLIIEPAPKNNDYELLSVYTEIGVKPRKELEERGNKASTTDGYWVVKKGDIVVNKLLAWMGAIGISEYDGVTSPAYDILRATRPIVGIFYHNLFRTPICISELRKHSRGIMDMRLRLYFDKFGDVRVPYPPLEEQILIVNFIQNITEKIEKAIRLKESEIEKLKEYKGSLINSVVTGKVRVV